MIFIFGYYMYWFILEYTLFRYCLVMENTIDHILWVLLIFLYQSAHIFLMDYGNSLN